MLQYTIRRQNRGFVPYAQRGLNDLLFTAKLIKQREDALPYDLILALNSRGIEVSSL